MTVRCLWLVSVVLVATLLVILSVLVGVQMSPGDAGC